MTENFLCVGCCGWQKSHAAYFQHFDLLEIDSTFYRLPKVETAEKWRAEAPQNFTYTLKALQIITHEPYSPTYAKGGLDVPGYLWKEYGSFRRSDAVYNAWKETMEIALILQAPVVVFQCPVQFNPTPDHIRDMREFFSTVERKGLRFAWEPRGPQWKSEEIRDLCKDLDLIHCVDPFMNTPTYGIPRYYRLHGSADYTYKFTDADLELLKSWVKGQDTYCLFNNTEMWIDAQRFKGMMGV